VCKCSEPVLCNAPYYTLTINPLKPTFVFILINNPVWASKRTPFFTITKINYSTLFKEIIIRFEWESYETGKYKLSFYWLLKQVGHIFITSFERFNHHGCENRASQTKPHNNYTSRYLCPPSVILYCICICAALPSNETVDASNPLLSKPKFRHRCSNSRSSPIRSTSMLYSQTLSVL
jgi:hypothetical protein